MCIISISVCLLLPQRVTEESSGYSVPGRHLCGYTHKSWLMQSFNSYPEVAIWISKYGTHRYSAGKYFEPLISEYYLTDQRSWSGLFICSLSHDVLSGFFITGSHFILLVTDEWMLLLLTGEDCTLPVSDFFTPDPESLYQFCDSYSI